MAEVAVAAEVVGVVVAEVAVVAVAEVVGVGVVVAEVAVVAVAEGHHQIGHTMIWDHFRRGIGIQFLHC